MSRSGKTRAERMYRNCQRWEARAPSAERKAFWRARAEHWLAERLDELVDEINGAEA